MGILTEEELFAAAIQKPFAERAAFLDRACGHDATLRAQVEALLAAHDHPDSLLEVPACNATIDTPTQITERPGTQIGPYKLLQQIGEGGMGVVYMAEQSEPVQRKVALKVIKPGMDSRQVIARFEAERQALSMMDHVNIARVLDCGTTGGEPGGVSPGRPYFVMELVHGVPITKYCDDNRLTPRQRLELFVPVCQAIQHAHQKGIIHRDIKPSNVMVTLYDGKPVPKVIDFGVAKATEQKLTERTLFTQYGTMVGTLEYMSPEQAEMSALGVDTRSDIFSLGVLLYELLTGSTPLSHKRMKEAAYAEILRMIKEEEPQKPSTRLSDSGEALASISAQRNTEPAKLSKLMRGELDWIVMKTLEKDRNRRYETANGFAMDVQRYLADEAVQACPPSAVYRLKKFVRRNRPQVIAASLVFLALLAGIAGTTIGLIEARIQEAEALRQAGLARDEATAKEQARAEEQRQRVKAEKAAAAEKQALAKAQRRLKQIEKANDILSSIFYNLDPKEIAQAERPLQAILVEKLDQAVAQLEGESIGDPLVVAAMQVKFSSSLLGLGEPGKAIVLLEKARATYLAKLGPEHPDTLESMNNLAVAYQTAGKLDLALPLFEETLKLRKAKLGPEHPGTLNSMHNLADAYLDAGKLDLALPLAEETFKLHKAKLGPEHPETLFSMNNLAQSFLDAGKLDLALPLFEETLKLRKAKLGPDHPLTFVSMSSLGEAYKAAGKLDLALPLFEEFLKLAKAKLGPEHPNTLASMNNLAAGYQAAGKWDLALPLVEEALKLQKAKLGPEHPHTLSSMNNLALAYKAARKLDLALPLFEETLKLRKAKLGPEHPDTLISMDNLALVYKVAGKLDLALPLFEETLNIFKAKLGPEHPDTLISMHNLAGAYQAAGKLDLALPLIEETLKLQKAKLGPEHPETLSSMNNLATVYRADGKLDLALPLFEETLKLFKAKLGPEHPHTLASMGNLGVAYCDANQGEKAAATFQEFLAAERKHAKPDDPQFAGLLIPVALHLSKCHQHAAAEALLRESLAICEKTQPDIWTTFNTKSLLGGALLGQKKYADAEPLLLAGYEGLKVQVAKIPQAGMVCLSEALNRLIELYTATDKPDELKKWQADQQIEEARKELMRRNPGFDGQLRSMTQLNPIVRDGVVIDLRLCTDHVSDISPVRALKGLRVVWFQGSSPESGLLTDLSPLKELALTSVSISQNPHLWDLSPLEGMPMTLLGVEYTNVESIDIVKEMPIKALWIMNTQVADLSPLAGKSLDVLRCTKTNVKTLRGLSATQVKQLLCTPEQLPDKAELARLGVTHINGKPVAEFWKEEAAKPKPPTEAAPP